MYNYLTSIDKDVDKPIVQVALSAVVIITFKIQSWFPS